MAVSSGQSRQSIAGLGGGNVRLRHRRRPNGLEVNPRGQGPRGYGSAARCLPAFEARDAGGVTPSNTAERAGSAGGPKPGRDGFYLELGAELLEWPNNNAFPYNTVLVREGVRPEAHPIRGRAPLRQTLRSGGRGSLGMRPGDSVGKFTRRTWPFLQSRVRN